MSAQPRFAGSPGAPRELNPWDGVLLVNKPSGPTSHDIVATIRRHFQIKKVGHGGTLDPQATGLLTILLGKGTKLSNHFLGSDKVYEGTMRLGITTDSQDAQGNITGEQDPSGITEQQVLDQMAALKGDIYQTPPMVSAIKVDGVPLYKLARKGQTIERKARIVHIYDFTMQTFEPPRTSFRVKCSKGTYVRTLCADIGEALGCGALLDQLHRTACGSLSVADAYPLETIMEWNGSTLAEHILPMRNFV